MKNFIIDKIYKCDGFYDSNSYLCGITFDGNFFYVTDFNNAIVYVLDDCFQCVKKIDTCRVYNFISYDCYEECFWAAKMYDNRIYKLDNCFCELTSISLNDLINSYGYIKGFCIEDKNNLLICFYNCIIQINKEYDYTFDKLIQNENAFTAITKSSKFIFVTSKNKENFFLNSYSCDYNRHNVFSILSDFFVTDITIYNCKGEDILIILAIKDCESYIFKCIFRNICISDSLSICSNENLCDCTVNCNTNIIESIALIETALSHILNAEGEKIQKAVSFSDNICDLLKINDSVNKTIKNISYLEQLLLHKLELAKDDFECK